MGEYVGIDFHRRRSVVVRLDEAGERLSVTRVVNDPLEVADAVLAGGPPPPVALEATYGWYWIVDWLIDLGCEVHLAHPYGVWGGKQRWVKNDVVDAAELADLLRCGRLAESWIAPPLVRERRELVRFRHKLVEQRSSLKAQIHAVLAKEGHNDHPRLWSGPGAVWLNNVEPGSGFAERVDTTQGLIPVFDEQVDRLDGIIHQRLVDDPGYQTLLGIEGIGRVLAAIFVAEIGDAVRFDGPRRLTSWAGLTSKHQESDLKVRRGRITKQGSRLVRWAAIEAVTSSHCHPHLKDFRRHLETRRPPNVAKVAAARKLLTWVYWAMRDHHVRCLDAHRTEAA